MTATRESLWQSLQETLDERDYLKQRLREAEKEIGQLEAHVEQVEAARAETVQAANAGIEEALGERAEALQDRNHALVALQEEELREEALAEEWQKRWAAATKAAQAGMAELREELDALQHTLAEERRERAASEAEAQRARAQLREELDTALRELRAAEQVPTRARTPPTDALIRAECLMCPPNRRPYPYPRGVSDLLDTRVCPPAGPPRAADARAAAQFAEGVDRMFQQQQSAR